MLTLSEETETLARRLAAEQRLSVDTTIRQALERQAAAGRPVDAAAGRVSEEEKARRLAVLREFQERFDALPVLVDPRPIQEIVDEINEL